MSKKLTFRDYFVILLLAVVVALWISGAFHAHDWQAATCTEPQICSSCKAEQGEPLGHDWSAATCSEYQTCQRCGATGGQRLDHTWTAATCTEPERCSICGKKRHWYSMSSGHDWIYATCTEPQTCSICGVTEGEPRGHDFPAYAWLTISKATCQTEGEAQATCRRCDVTDTKSIPVIACHANDWTVIQKATAAAPGVRVKLCTMCGAEIAREDVPYLYHSSGSGNGSNFNTYDNEGQQNTSSQYVLNKSSRVFHYPHCRDVPKISPENYGTTNRTRSDLVSSGWRSCGHCGP